MFGVKAFFSLSESSRRNTEIILFQNESVYWIYLIKNKNNNNDLTIIYDLSVYIFAISSQTLWPTER